MQYDDYMNPTDTMMWEVERNPQLRSTMFSFLVIEKTPDPDLFDEMVMDMIESVPRFRQRVVRDEYEIAPQSSRRSIMPSPMG